jgi:predicted site-specific integrase-resolvase
MAQISDLRGSKEACERIGIDRSTLSRWIKDGTAKPAMQLPISNGAYLFTNAEVERLAAIWSALKAAKAQMRESA